MIIYCDNCGYNIRSKNINQITAILEKDCPECGDYAWREENGNN